MYTFYGHVFLIMIFEFCLLTSYVHLYSCITFLLFLNFWLIRPVINLYSAFSIVIYIVSFSLPKALASWISRSLSTSLCLLTSFGKCKWIILINIAGNSERLLWPLWLTLSTLQLRLLGLCWKISPCSSILVTLMIW